MKQVSVKFKNRVKKKGLEMKIQFNRLLKLAEEHLDKNRITIRNNHFYDKFTNELVDDKILNGQRLVPIKNQPPKVEQAKPVLKKTFEEEYQDFIDNLKKQKEEKENKKTASPKANSFEEEYQNFINSLKK